MIFFFLVSYIRVFIFLFSLRKRVYNMLINTRSKKDIIIGPDQTIRKNCIAKSSMLWDFGYHTIIDCILQANTTHRNSYFTLYWRCLPI